jgi:uncharacterized protein YodC (DUF2158 family)
MNEAAMEEFKPGDVVRLKSGGPPMTCESGPNEDGLVTCQWFDKNGRIEGRRFYPAVLVRCECDAPEPAASPRSRRNAGAQKGGRQRSESS